MNIKLLTKLFRTVLEANEKSDKYYFFINFSGHVDYIDIFYSPTEKGSGLKYIYPSGTPSDEEIEGLIKEVVELANE